MSETVTEAAFNRKSFTAYIDFAVGVLIWAIAMSTDDVELMIYLSVFAALFLSWSMSQAVNGYNRKIWGRFSDSNWTLDDVDTDDFADGPVEVDT